MKRCNDGPVELYKQNQTSYAVHQHYQLQRIINISILMNKKKQQLFVEQMLYFLIIFFIGF